MKSRNKIQTNGSAIYGNGYKTAFEIKQEGFGTSTTDPASFTNCRYGIFADRIRLHSQNNKMEKMGTGYRAQLVNNGVDILFNHIDADYDAVQLFHCHSLNHNHTFVSHNKIIFGNSDLNKAYVGIRVEESQMQNDNSRINNNEITFRSGATAANTAILTRNVHTMLVANNIITMSNNIYNYDGIYMTGCKYVAADCNVITGSADYTIQVPVDQSAIRLLVCEAATVGCNTVSSTKNGLLLQSHMLVADFLGNNFHEHLYAFHYGEFGAAPDQDLKGNLWHNQTPPAGGWLAWNENQNYDVVIGPWNEVGPGTNAYPDIAYQYPQGWFKPALGTNTLCENTLANPPEIYCQDEYPTGLSGLISDMEERIARDSIMNDPYTEETRWMLKRSLLEKIEQHPVMLNNSLINTFYLNALNTALAELKQADDEKVLLYLIDSVTTDFLMQKKIQFEAYRLQLLSETESLGIALDSGWNIASIISNIEIIHENIAEALTEADSLQNINDSERVIESDILKGVYASVASAEVIESNEKIVNEIYLSTIGKDVFTFSADQKHQLYEIAEQCPLSGGPGVNFARALYALADESKWYNDRTICYGEGINLRQQVNNKEKAKPKAVIQPNPATDKATLVYNLPSVEKAEFIIYNSLGKMAGRYEITGGSNSFGFSTANLLPGMYYFMINSGNMMQANGKLVKIR